MKVFAPGKLILSGEHAVVYGQPALAMAVNRYVTATITRERVAHISFDLADLAHRSRLSFSALRYFKDRIKKKYLRFVRGEFSIREVLQKPFELVQFALGTFAEALNLSLPHGVNVRIQSDIPIGCGMGSSAATILSVIYATANYMQVDLSDETLFHLALEAENMQHGHSSGLDLRVSLHGGCFYLQNKERQTRLLPTLPMYLINTGLPESTTGQCIENVAPHFRTQHMGDDFAATTNAMDKALRSSDWVGMCDAIRANHLLLNNIGVVPPKVNQFIHEIERIDGVAKICGAGAVAGDQAGVVLAILDDEPALCALAMRYGYTLLPIIGESRGVHVV